MASGSYSETFGGGGWGGMRQYMQEKNKRIQEQLEDTVVKETDLFAGMYFVIDGRTEAASDTELKRLIISNGGKYEAYGKRTTHMIADHLAEGNQSWRNIRDRQKFSKMKIVTSYFITDCVKEMRRLPASRYLPMVLKDKNYQNQSLQKFNIVERREDNLNAVETTTEQIADDEQFERTVSHQSTENDTQPNDSDNIGNYGLRTAHVDNIFRKFATTSFGHI